MSSTQSNDSLRELNAKLLAEICELRKKVAEDEVEKTKLRQELKARTDKNIPVITTSQENNDDDIEFTKSQVIEQELTKELLTEVTVFV
ncbi:hypothetical protein RhiirA5_428705 [Rhizophagus irregularis]|uniref:Uncharacterized protein n=1 Tax=Rhizophagus irregularis TaxID=588596 RepID=A0A2N0S8B8_9GLOM|nr:hypothetical protein RhiirA5_428705 [Rhizophagus irregularis]PKC71802.1 hypothetical protein RhiirA1_453130 [Rhizophagus irregularis]